jgi:hypothetical protein
MSCGEVREALRKKTGKSARTLRDRVQKLRVQAVVQQDDAWLVLAYQEGLDLSEWLDRGELDRIRNIVKNIPVGQIVGSPVIPQIERKTSQRLRGKTRKTLELSFGNVDDALLENLAAQAKRMAEIYVVFYVFENSVRNVIALVMSKNHGKTWWDKVPTKVADYARDRIKDEINNPWHGKRGGHPINYIDFDHYASIVCDSSLWPLFRGILPSQEWFRQRMDELRRSRNTVAHSGVLQSNDMTRVQQYFRDWQRQIEGVKHLPV